MEKQCIFSIFGATGDLAQRKLLPALYFLENEKLLSNVKVMCIARKEKTTEQFKREISESIRKFSRIKINDEILDKLLSKIFYHMLDFSDSADYLSLKNSIQSVSGQKCELCNRIFYLAVPPSLFETITSNLQKMKLDTGQKESFVRVMFEKPFGNDLRSAKELNKEITRTFDESQIFRIDHYMAKELVQNMLVLRFANSIFEPLWNKEYIDHVQITVAETLGIENRGDYYDKFGALRDVVQNHMMQLLTLVAMGEPKAMNVNEIRKEKVKVLKSISISKNDVNKHIVRAQYGEGLIGGKQISAYTEEPEVNKKSNTETFAALKLEIKNKMWKGVPFYLRTGKRLKDRGTEIVIVYKKVPFGLFPSSSLDRNMMIIRVQPYEGITLQFNAKVPGNRVIIDNVTMDFCHECKFGPNSPESYERLLQDAMTGDQTLFTSWDEAENAWRIVDPIIKNLDKTNLVKYSPGTWGPKEANKMIERDGRKWVEPKKPAYADLLDAK